MVAAVLLMLVPSSSEHCGPQMRIQTGHSAAQLDDARRCHTDLQRSNQGSKSQCCRAGHAYRLILCKSASIGEASTCMHVSLLATRQLML